MVHPGRTRRPAGLGGTLTAPARARLIRRAGPARRRTIVSALAALVGLRVDREREARLKAERAAAALRASERERTRFVHELHDDAVQRLVVLARRLEVLRGELQGQAPEAAGALQEIQELARQVADSLRRLIRGIRPPELEDLGLAPALRHLLGEFASHASELGGRTGLRLGLFVAGEPHRLPSDMELGLYRIAQEALSNVVHHSGASWATVCLAFRPGRVQMVVHDDGVLAARLLPSRQGNHPAGHRARRAGRFV